MNSQEPQLPSPRELEGSTSSVKSPDTDTPPLENAVIEKVQGQLSEGVDPDEILKDLADSKDEAVQFDPNTTAQIRANFKAYFSGELTDEADKSVKIDEIVASAPDLLNLDGATEEEAMLAIRTLDSAISLISGKEWKDQIIARFVQDMDAIGKRLGEKGAGTFLDFVRAVRFASDTDMSSTIDSKLLEGDILRRQIEKGDGSATELLFFIAGRVSDEATGNSVAAEKMIAESMGVILQGEESMDTQETKSPIPWLENHYFSNDDTDQAGGIDDAGSTIRSKILERYDGENITALLDLMESKNHGGLIFEYITRNASQQRREDIANKLGQRIKNVNVSSFSRMGRMLQSFRSSTGKEYDSEFERILDVPFSQAAWGLIKEGERPELHFVQSAVNRFSPDQVREFTGDVIQNLKVKGFDPELLGFLNSDSLFRRSTLKDIVELDLQYFDEIKKNYTEVKQSGKPDMWNSASQIISRIAMYGDRKQAEGAVQFISDEVGLDRSVFFTEHGLDEGVMIEAWRKSSIDLLDSFQRNMEAIKRLEETRPGICAALSGEFGIRNFGRYPDEILTAQFDQMSEQGEYGIILYPEFDHLKAFGSDESYKSLSAIGERAKGEFAVRVAEAGSKFDVARRLLKFKKNYGEASFMILGAHGSQDLMQFGSDGNKDEVLIADLDSENLETVTSVLKPGSDLMLQSCSTGADEGIGQRLAQRTGLHVIAPKVTSRGFKSIDYVLDQGVPRFNVEFNDSPKSEFDYKINN